MKKILVLLIMLSSACSTAPGLSEDEKAWIGKIYNQGWYWSTKDLAGDGIVSDTLASFQSDGSFIAGFIPWNNTRPDDFPRQEGLYVLDEAVCEDKVYYSFSYTFAGEKLTLYRGVAKGFRMDGETVTDIPSIYWSNFYNRNEPPNVNASNTEKREWLIEHFRKENMKLNRGPLLALKKNSRASLSQNSAFTDYVQGNSSTSFSINSIKEK